MAQPPPENKIRVLLAEDHTLVRQGFRRILEDDPTVNVVGEARTGLEAIELCKTLKPDVVVMDLSMPDLGGMEATAEILKADPKIKILILSMYSEELYAIQAFKSGASGYLTKSSAPGELLSAIHKVSKGEKYISLSLTEKLANSFLFNENKSQGPALSARELQVLHLISEGKTLNQIAEELSLSPKTIGTYRERLLSKLNLKTTADLIRFGIIEGLKSNSPE